MTKLVRYSGVMLEAQEHYVKGSYRNRSHIAGVNGVQRLTIPLRKGKNNQMPIREVQIAYDEPWRARHWQSIRSAYGNAPFFEHYADLIRPFYKKKRYKYLWDFNLELLTCLMDLLQLEAELALTGSYQKDPEGWLDLRETIHPKRPSEDPTFVPESYAQVFEDRLGFLPNLSILDLLFCCGPESGNVLRRSVVDPSSEAAP